MKVKNGFILRKVSDTYVVVATGEAAKEFNGMITLNETGAFLWEKLAEGCKDISELTAKLLDEYDVPEDVATKDVAAFIARIRDAQLIEE